jgi:hypothetical protein
MSLLEVELHPPRYELEEGPTLRLLPETLTSLSPYFTTIMAALRFFKALLLCVLK